MTKKKLYRLVIISDSLRRDFQDPLKFFDRFKMVHLYRQANYGDMGEADFRGTKQVFGFFSTYRALHRLNPDIVAAPEPYQGFSRFTLISTKVMRLWLPAVLYAKKHHKILFFHSLENIPDQQRYGRFHLLLRLIMRWYAAQCNFIFFLNQGAKKNLLKAGVRKDKLNFKLWGNWGVDIREFKPGRKAEHPIVLFVGRLEKLKGLLDLYQAFAKLKKEYPKLQLWIVGEGSLATIQLSGVKYFGNLPNTKLPFLFQQAWITCVPAVSSRIWAEQVGMVNIQSLACGTPVVSTRSGAIPEFITREVGILVKESNPRQLTGALRKLLANPTLRKQLAVAARKFAKDRYDAKKNIIKIEKFLLRKIEST